MILQSLICCVAAKIVSLPHHRYVQEGGQAIARCQNRSDDETTFYSYVTTAIWYKDYLNGTATPIGGSGSVYADKHTLILSSMTHADQGLYYCCVPTGLCGNGRSEGTTVLLSTPAVIVAANPSYISTVGSNVTLICNIIDKGTPQASFAWRRNGNEINDENRSTINDTAMLLTLTNITMESGGTYFCTANGVITQRSDTVELIVEDSPEWSTTVIAASYGEDVILPCRVNVTSTNYMWEQVSGQSLFVQGSTNMTLKNGSLLLTSVKQSATFRCTVLSEERMILQFVELIIQMNDSILHPVTRSKLIYLLSTDARASCHDTELEEYLLVILQNYLYQMCGCPYVNVRVNCNDTGRSSAVYSIQLVGPMADEVLQLWLMQKENQKSEIELGVATFTICNETCTGVFETTSENRKNVLLIAIIISTAACILIILTILSLWIFYCCCRRMIRKGNYNIDKPVQSTDNTCPESGSMPAKYDKLNHTYSSTKETPAESSEQQITQSHADESQYLNCGNQEVEHRKKPTVKIMTNGKGVIRSNNVTAFILNSSNLNVDVNSVVVTPSKTHPSYVDVNLPSNTDHR